MIKKVLDKYPPLRYIISSTMSFVVDNLLYYLFLRYIFGGIAAMNELEVSTFSQLLARALSSFFNFNCNKYFAFRSHEKYSSALLKYYCVCLPQTAASVVLLDVFLANTSFTSDLLQTLLKILIEAMLFVISYFVQNKWVFKRKK